MLNVEKKRTILWPIFFAKVIDRTAENSSRMAGGGFPLGSYVAAYLSSI